MGRIVERGKLVEALAAERHRGRTIVFTNGCFDLIHPGHVRTLEGAKRLGDVLVVGLNSDRSVGALGKGAGRPILRENERAEVIAALAAVDYVTLFDEATPLELIRTVSPDVLVKGGDWSTEAIVGADWVSARGGRVERLPYQEGSSTTELIARIRRPATPRGTIRRTPGGATRRR